MTPSNQYNPPCFKNISGIFQNQFRTPLFDVKIAVMPYVHNIKHPFFYIPYFSDGSDEKSCEKVDIPSKGIWIYKYSQKGEKQEFS